MSKVLSKRQKLSIYHKNTKNEIDYVTNDKTLFIRMDSNIGPKRYTLLYNVFITGNRNDYMVKKWWQRCWQQTAMNNVVTNIVEANKKAKLFRRNWDTKIGFF